MSVFTSARPGHFAVSRRFLFLAIVFVAPAVFGEEPEGEPEPLDFPLKHNLKATEEEPFAEAKGWVPIEFRGKGEITIEGDSIELGRGNDMTGIVWTGPLARMNYEISLEAKRVAGGDFFCGLTFPYNDSACSLIVGGWGGTLVGLSSLDGYDAYNNETARFRDFDDDVWYRFRVRVRPTRIEAWIDDKQYVDVDTSTREVGLRWEMEKARPLGIATWRTSGVIRKVVLTSLGEEEEGEKDAQE
jgi:3-keto-disaccharide hydrolase